MKTKLITLLAVLCLGATSLAAADTKFGLAADNKIYAQQLVGQIMAANPGLLIAGMYCVSLGGEKQSIIASTLNVIGKPSDPEDILRGSTTISPNLKVPKLGIMLPLRDRAGNDIGSLGLAFKFQPGEDQVKYFAAATAIRDRVAQQIPALANLFESTP